MELSIKENGSLALTSKMEEVFRFGLMAPDMTDSGRRAWLMAMADWYTLKEMSTKVNGLMIKQMGTVSIPILTAVVTKDNGTRINNTASEWSNGQTEQNTKANMSKE